MTFEPPWYKKAEEWLMPFQGGVMALCAVIAVVSVWMILQKSATLRTFWVTYVLMP